MLDEFNKIGANQTTGIRHVIFVNHSCENASAYYMFQELTTSLFYII
jgi:hypothetical protein